MSVGLCIEKPADWGYISQSRIDLQWNNLCQIVYSYLDKIGLEDRVPKARHSVKKSSQLGTAFTNCLFQSLCFITQHLSLGLMGSCRFFHVQYISCGCPADPRGVTWGGLTGCPTQLDIVHRWWQGLFRLQVMSTGPVYTVQSLTWHQHGANNK